MRTAPRLALALASAAAVLPALTGTASAAPATGTTVNYTEGRVQMYVENQLFFVRVRDYGDRATVDGFYNPSTCNADRTDCTYHRYAVGTSRDPLELPAGQYLSVANGLRSGSLSVTVPVTDSGFRSYTTTAADGTRRYATEYLSGTTTQTLTASFSALSGADSHDRQHGRFSNSDGTCTDLTERSVYQHVTTSGFGVTASDTGDYGDSSALTRAEETTGAC